MASYSHSISSPDVDPGSDDPRYRSCAVGNDPSKCTRLAFSFSQSPGASTRSVAAIRRAFTRFLSLEFGTLEPTSGQCATRYVFFPELFRQPFSRPRAFGTRILALIGVSNAQEYVKVSTNKTLWTLLTTRYARQTHFFWIYFQQSLIAPQSRDNTKTRNPKPPPYIQGLSPAELGMDLLFEQD